MYGDSVIQPRYERTQRSNQGMGETVIEPRDLVIEQGDEGLCDPIWGLNYPTGGAGAFGIFDAIDSFRDKVPCSPSRIALHLVTR